MADIFSREKRSEIMSAIRSESGIERLPLWAAGMRLRRHPSGVLGRPDFGNKARKIALFIDGCFWHGCPKCFRMPKSNVEFWRNKIDRNQRRDRKVTRGLRRDGWTVLRVRECELKKEGAAA